MECYETMTHQSGLFPLLESRRNDFDSLDSIHPLSSDTICDVIQRTRYWETICVSPLIVRLLKAAIVSEDVKLVKMLLSKGVDIHQRIDEVSPLEKACWHSSPTDAGKLIFGVLFDYADKPRLNELNPERNKQGLIHLLTKFGWEWKLCELLKNGANPNLLTGGGLRCSALHISIFNGLLPLTRVLLDNGADPTLTDISGRDAALYAALCGRASVLDLLDNSENRSWHINWQRIAKIFTSALPETTITDFGSATGNALHLSALKGHIDCLRFYTDREIITDLNTTYDGIPYTPMHLSAMNGHLEAVKFLRDRHADINVRTAEGQLPLHLAVTDGCLEIVKVLLESGSDTAADSSGMTPLMHAYELGNQSIIDCLREADGQNSTVSPSRLHKREQAKAMEVAILNDNLKLCKELHGQGCDLGIDILRFGNISPLILAIVCRRPNIITWLLKSRVCTLSSHYYHGSNTSAFHEIIEIAELNDVLPVFLERYMNDGGYILDESPGLVDTAVEAQNRAGLELLLEHIKENARHYG